MRSLRLSGRESAVVKAIGFSLPTPAKEVMERTGLQIEDVTDIINALLGMGYIESVPFKEEITQDDVETFELEVNPSFAKELRKALGFGRR